MELFAYRRDGLGLPHLFGNNVFRAVDSRNNQQVFSVGELRYGCLQTASSGRLYQSFRAIWKLGDTTAETGYRQLFQDAQKP